MALAYFLGHPVYVDGPQTSHTAAEDVFLW